MQRMEHAGHTTVPWSRYLQVHVLPVVGNGDTRFRPVYASDIGQLIEIRTRNNVLILRFRNCDRWNL